MLPKILIILDCNCQPSTSKRQYKVTKCFIFTVYLQLLYAWILRHCGACSDAAVAFYMFSRKLTSCFCYIGFTRPNWTTLDSQVYFSIVKVKETVKCSKRSRLNPVSQLPRTEREMKWVNNLNIWNLSDWGLNDPPVPSSSPGMSHTRRASVRDG